jgi:hypothetical protein
LEDGPERFRCPDCEADVTEAVWAKANADRTAVYRLGGWVGRLRRRREKPRTFTVAVKCPNRHTHRYHGRYPEDDD